MTPCAVCHLRAASCFRPAPAELTERVRLGQRKLGPGAHVRGEEASANQVHTLFSGFAVCYRLLADGRRQIIEFLLPGDLIGPWAAASKGFGIVAATEVVLCVLSRDGFGRILIEGGRLAFELGETLLLATARLERRLLLLGRQRPTERLAFLFLDLHDRLRSRDRALDGLRVPLSYPLMSDALGVSRAQLARSLAELRELGWVQREQDGFALRAEDEMAQFCGYDGGPAIEPRTLI